MVPRIGVPSPWRLAVVVAMAFFHICESHTHLQVHSAPRASDDAATCASLQNHVSHSTVRIKVGSPPQPFDIIADTGSDTLIVQSCICQDRHRCSAEDKCFRGTNRSSTFHLSKSGNSSEGALLFHFTFGSGEIDAVVSTDAVTIGKVSTTMSDSLMLMVNRELNIQGPFEGILGLGLPKAEETQLAIAKHQQHANPADPQQPQVASVPQGFLEKAGIRRFSMCFNDDNSDGVLRLGGGSPPAPELGSIGQLHWGLDFRGVSVGDHSAAALFCDQSSMQPGQETPCGAIPDSGTTVMMGPPEHIAKLFEGVCDSWARCREQAAKSPEVPKVEVFQLLLTACEEWAGDDGDISELPSLHFTVAGSEGTTQTLELPPDQYVLKTLAREMHHVTKKLLGIFPVDIVVPTNKTHEVCVPAFGTQDYNTMKNGPVWILGTPIFYRFLVHYNLVSQPPSIAFAEGPCGHCDEEGNEQPEAPAKAGFLVRSNATRAADKQLRRRMRPRWHSGPLRTPDLDTSQPL